MPPLPSPGNVIRITLGFTESGSVIYGARFFLAYTGGPASQADLNLMTTQAESGFSSNLAAHTPSDVALTSVLALDLAGNTGLEGVWTGSVAGTDANPSPESGTATIVNYHVLTRYRGGHPKAFMPGGSNAQVSEPGRWLGTYTAAYATGFQALVSNVNNHSYTSLSTSGQCAVSWYHGGTANTDPSQWAPKNRPALRPTPVVMPVTSVTVNSLIGSQRRRRTSTGA